MQALTAAAAKNVFPGYLPPAKRTYAPAFIANKRRKEQTHCRTKRDYAAAGKQNTRRKIAAVIGRKSACSE